MSATTGLTGDVVSWSGTFNAAMLALLKPATFTLDTSADALDSTGYAAGALRVRSIIKGLRSWRGSFGGYLATPVTGMTGNISGAGYSTNIQRWSMQFAANAIDATALPVSSGFRSYLPSLVSVRGTYDAIVDSSTAIKEAGSSSDPAAATFTIQTSNTLAASIITTGAQVVSRVGDLSVVRYTFEVDGDVVSVGSANVIPAASTIATPVAGTMVLKAHEAGASDKTYTGSAFWTGISITVDPAAVTAIQVDFQGDGAITPA